MPAALLPPDETERLGALLALRILGTEPTEAFDVFPALAKDLFSVPVAAITLIDENRLWFKSSVGLGELTGIPRDDSFCAHAILNPADTLYVPDATKDPRFADSPLVVGQAGLRFYVGVPIVGPSGHALGALCVLDREPREVGEAALDQLRRLAIGVESALKLHGSVQRLRDLERTDPLTGLDNRSGFSRRLASAFASRDGSARSRTGLLLVDLDGFRSVNDLFGHAGGDAALAEVARRLRRVTSGRNALSRLGGDAFGILVEDGRDDDALQALAEAVHAALRDPFEIEDHAVPLRASIGVAACSERGGDPETLMREADRALSEAKRAGRGGIRFAVTAEGARNAELRSGRRAMEAMLRDALLPPGREPFVLAFQPIYRNNTSALAGFEALVRWPDGDGRVRPPAEFIPVAESTGLIVQLDRWVLNEACAAAASWPGGLQVSSNLSAANFFAGDLVEDVRAILLRHGLAPDRLKLEITETVLLHDRVRVRAVIERLRALGVRVVLDDFGAGYSSIAYLRDYPFDGLKIDRSFTAELEADTRSRAFTTAIVEMAQALGIDVTAEGVETDGQLDVLRGTDIATVQGYLLGRPMPPGAALDLARQPRAADGRSRAPRPDPALA